MTRMIHTRCGYAALIEQPEHNYFCLCCRRDVPAWQIEYWTRIA